MRKTRRRGWRVAGLSLVLLSAFATGCASRVPSGPTEAPLPCTEVQDWPESDVLDEALVETCAEPSSPAVRALCDRGDYLEAYCLGVNAYIRSLRGAE